MQNKETIRIAQIMGKWVGGGVEAVVLNYYRHLDRNKIEFDFICDSDSTCIPYEEIKSLGGKVILIPPYQKIFKYIKELTKILKENKYNIVHSHINTLSVFPLYCAKKAKVPVRIAHNHSTTNKKEWKRNIIKCILKPFSKIFSTEYMSCSEYAGRWLFGNKTFDNNNVYVLNNAVDLNKLKYNLSIRDEYRKKLNIKKEQLVIGNVGRMVETKNHTFLLDIFKLISEEHDSILVLVGQGPLENYLKQKAKKLGLYDKVIFLGQREDVYNIYQAFDLFVLPSLYEGFGMVLLEAQATNLPCIVSTGVPQEAKLINDFKFISLNESLITWKNSIIDLFKTNKRIDNSKILTEKGFDIVNEAKKLEKKYFSLLEEDL